MTTTLNRPDGIWRPEEIEPDGWIVVRYVSKGGRTHSEVVQFRGKGPLIFASAARAQDECKRRNGS